MPRITTHLARRPRLLPAARISTSMAAACLALVGCDPGQAPAPAPQPAVGAAASNAAPADPAAATTPPASPATPKDEVKIMVEKWENGNTKFWNEMRRDAAGKWLTLV